MAVPSKGVNLRFGVLGGGSVDQGSGADILKNIQSIVSQIEKRGYTKLKFGIDVGGTTTSLNSISQQVQKTSATINSSLKGQKSEIAANNREWKSLETQMKQVNNFEWNSLKVQLVGQKSEVKANNLEWKQLEAQIKATNNTEWNNLKSQLKSQESEVKANNAEWKKLETQINKTNATATKTQVSSVDNSFAKTTRTVSAIDPEQANLSGLSNEYTKLNSLKTEFEKAPTKGNLDAYRAQATVVKTYTDELNAATQATKKKTAEDNNSLTASTHVQNKLEEARSTYEKYSSAIQKNTVLNQKWQDFLNKSATGGYNGNWRQMESDLAGLNRETREASANTQTFSAKIKGLFSQHFATATALVGVHLIQQALSQMYQNVVQLDAALVNLQVATGYTRAETKELLNTYSQMAKELGSTTVEVANASDTWLRQGYSIEQSNILIKDSMMLSKLGQMDSAEATSALTSAMRGYQMSVEDVTSIVDRMTKVDMSAAVSSSYIATAMSETATSANLAGVSMDKLIGYIAAVGSTTQDSAEAVGNSFKSIFARMGNIKQGLLEDSETGESLSNVESALSGVDIKLRDSESEFRNFGDVLDEVAGKWDSYSSVEKRTLAVSFAGGRAPEQQ